MKSITEFIEYKLPDELLKFLEDFTLTKNRIGCSKSDIFHVQNNQGIGYYLKIMQPEIGRSLEAEKQALIFLERKIPVPKVIFFSKFQGREFLMTSEIKGDVSMIAETDEDKLRNIKILAQGLRLIHSIDISNCSLQKPLNYLLHTAELRLKEGLVKNKEFDKRWSNRDPENLLNQIKNVKIHQIELVFTHGDYCLPNIIIDNGELSGFIDLAYAGVNDRYFDLAAVIWSIGFNFGETWIQPFLEEYGIQNIDWDRVRFYQMLNEFL